MLRHAEELLSVMGMPFYFSTLWCNNFSLGSDVWYFSLGSFCISLLYLFRKSLLYGHHSHKLIKKNNSSKGSSKNVLLPEVWQNPWAEYMYSKKVYIIPSQWHFRRSTILFQNNFFIVKISFMSVTMIMPLWSFSSYNNN